LGYFLAFIGCMCGFAGGGAAAAPLEVDGNESPAAYSAGEVAVKTRLAC
jgi:hypothetical protein